MSVIRKSEAPGGGRRKESLQSFLPTLSIGNLCTGLPRLRKMAAVLLGGGRATARTSSQSSCWRKSVKPLDSRLAGISSTEFLPAPPTTKKRRLAGCGPECGRRLEVPNRLLNIQEQFSFLFFSNCDSLPHHPSCKCDSRAFSSVTLFLNK